MTLYKEGDKVRYNGREYEVVNVTPTTYDLDSQDYYEDSIPEDELEYVPEPGSVAEAEAASAKLTKTERIERLEKSVRTLLDESRQDFLMNRRTLTDDIPRLQSKVGELVDRSNSNGYYLQNQADQLNKLKNTVLELEKRLQDIEQESANKSDKEKVTIKISPEVQSIKDLTDVLIKNVRNAKFH